MAAPGRVKDLGQLVIFQKTVEMHLRQIFDKLGVSARRELIGAGR
jgi:DNA-binding NarL/FixJ family response regulator